MNLGLQEADTVDYKINKIIIIGYIKISIQHFPRKTFKPVGNSDYECTYEKITLNV